MKKLTKLFKVLGNERRLKIIKILRIEKEMTVGEISNRINLSFKSTSKHLQQLDTLGLISHRQISNKVVYYLSELKKDSIEYKLMNLI